MSTSFTIDNARKTMSGIVRQLVNAAVARSGRTKTALRDVSKETGISCAWLERALWNTADFAPLLHYYQNLCVALERDLARRKLKVQEDEQVLNHLRGVRKNALNQTNRRPHRRVRSRHQNKIRHPKRTLAA